MPPLIRSLDLLHRCFTAGLGGGVCLRIIRFPGDFHSASTNRAVLSDEQMSNKVRVEHQPAKLVTSSKKESYHSDWSYNTRTLTAVFCAGEKRTHFFASIIFQGLLVIITFQFVYLCAQSYQEIIQPVMVFVKLAHNRTTSGSHCCQIPNRFWLESMF